VDSSNADEPRSDVTPVQYLPTMTDDQLQSVLDAVRSELGDPSTWGAPVEMRDSLALCALNSAHSLRAGTPSVRRVLRRYRDHRLAAGADPEQDSGPDLLAVIDAAGGPEAFSDEVTRNRSKLPGTKRLRAEGIYEALGNLEGLGVTTAEQLRERSEDDEVRRAWTRSKGLGPLSWQYLLMNAGLGELTKPDVMIRRFLGRARGEKVSVARATRLLTDAAQELGVETRALDRAIWLHESPSGASSTSSTTTEETA
jgi:hypothetical protein